MKKILKFLSSMPFAVALLILLAGACALCSTISQGLNYDAYAAQYGERTAGLIMALRLDDAFHSWWFIALSGILCLNLLCCNLVRLPSLIRRVKAFRDPGKAEKGRVDAQAKGNGDPVKLIRALHFSGRIEKDEETRVFAASNLPGFWGAWICHLGILLLIVGFALGQMTAEQYTVYAMPGKTVQMDDTGLSVRIDDFRIEKTEQGSAKQYTTWLTVSDPKKQTAQSGTASVNAPANLYGYKFFQNSIGWGASVTILKNGEELQADSLCVGEFIPIKDKPELVIYFTALYPDADNRDQPTPETTEPVNPGYLYQVYYQGQILGMNVLRAGEELTIDEYTVLFNHPRHYTLLAVKRDRFTILVLLGGVILLAGLILAFWMIPRKIWAVREDNEWTVCGASLKNGILFREKFDQAAKDTGFEPSRPGEDHTRKENM